MRFGNDCDHIMSYKVLARKWRPQKFCEVVGQTHITLTLQNAIKKDRIGHAYLFVGPRGIGKTTSARVFAKALNCANLEIDVDGMPEPCCTCGTCQEIAEGNCLDVIEIDGASHNKVEDIRGLRDTVPYAPTNGRKYKIYIIDEVHMLTTGAWNALLKTLEEPPPHVKFLFATTEAHKVLPTIVSRCQRFDLKRISIPLIVEQLRKIAEHENILVDDGALTAIARAADGGMRDAQSIFDQLIAFCGGDSPDSQIKENDVVDVFGMTSNADLKRLAVALLENEATSVVHTIHVLADHGRNLERLYADLLSYFRNMLIFHYASNPELIVEVSESELEEFKSLKLKYSPGTIQRLVEGLMAHEGKIRNYLNKRIFIEVTLLRVMREAHSVTIDDLLTRLREIRKNNFSNLEEPRVTDSGRRLDSSHQPEKDQSLANKKKKTTEICQGAEDALQLGPELSVNAGSNYIGAQPHLKKENTDADKKNKTFSRKEIWETLEKDEFVLSVCKRFNGKIVDVRG